MDLDWPWLLLAVPMVFALGWIASRLDLRQWRRVDRAAPRAYFKGLNLLLNDQQDKAIDAFIEAVQADADTAELHFALGNLFRRRGEFERAVRVHQHLLQRPDLSVAERQRAQNALADDFMKAGLLDRAETAYRALEGSPFDTEARLALLALHERGRDWPAAIHDAQALEAAGTGSFAIRIAHYHCELAQAADDRADHETAAAHLAQARQVAPQAVRPLEQLALRLERSGRTADALACWAELRRHQPEQFTRLATDYARCSLAAGDPDTARATLQPLARAQPSLDLVRALAALDGGMPAAAVPLTDLLKAVPSLPAAQELLSLPAAAWPADAQAALTHAVAQAARPLNRYRCAACAFESQRWFWHCPGCLGWDTFPPQRVAEQ
ncbi:MAG: lipopolysaccharide assembly protein LapB [Aquabacterium sp.]